MKCLNRFVNEIAADEVNGVLRSKFPDVPQVIFMWACQVGVDGGLDLGWRRSILTTSVFVSPDQDRDKGHDHMFDLLVFHKDSKA